MDITKKYNFPNISQTSDFYLASPSDYAKNFFYYMLSVGHFYCENSYFSTRNSGEYNSYLLIYVLSGKLNISTSGHIGYASAGDTVLIDCYNQHSYSAIEPTEFYYIHFDGVNSSSFAKEILRLNGNIHKSQYHIKHYNIIGEIVQKLTRQNIITESEISTLIHTILCDLVTQSASPYVNKYPQIINEALSIISTDYYKQIHIFDIAQQLNVSEQHLIRLFKSNLGLSPYKYLTKLRINMASLLLKSTDMTISEITENIGFSSESNFIKYFTKTYGTTPFKYKQLC